MTDPFDQSLSQSLSSELSLAELIRQEILQKKANDLLAKKDDEPTRYDPQKVEDALKDFGRSTGTGILNLGGNEHDNKELSRGFSGNLSNEALAQAFSSREIPVPMSSLGFAQTLVDFREGKAGSGQLGASAADAAIEQSSRLVKPSGVIGKVLGSAAIIVAGVIPFAEECDNASNYEKAGDAYGATIASNRKWYRAAAGAGGAATGFGASLVAPTGYTQVAGAGVGLVSGLLLDKAANALANEAFQKDPALKAEAAALQAKLNKTEAVQGKVDKLAKMCARLPGDAAKSYMDDSFAKGAQQMISTSLQTEANLRNQMGGLSNDQLRAAGEAHYIAFQQSSKDLKNSPVTREQFEAAQKVLKETGEMYKFLVDRPVPANDAAAQEHLQKMLGKLREANEKATYVVASYNLEQELHKAASMGDRLIAEKLQKNIDHFEKTIAENEERHKKGTYDKDHTPEGCREVTKVMQQELERTKSMLHEPKNNIAQLEEKDKKLREAGGAEPQIIANISNNEMLIKTPQSTHNTFNSAIRPAESKMILDTLAVNKTTQNLDLAPIGNETLIEKLKTTKTALNSSMLSGEAGIAANALAINKAGQNRDGASKGLA